jgi:hypothetical protein
MHDPDKPFADERMAEGDPARKKVGIDGKYSIT